MPAVRGQERNPCGAGVAITLRWRRSGCTRQQRKRARPLTPWLSGCQSSPREKRSLRPNSTAKSRCSNGPGCRVVAQSAELRCSPTNRQRCEGSQSYFRSNKRRLPSRGRSRLDQFGPRARPRQTPDSPPSSSSKAAKVFRTTYGRPR